ncbi:hypothetical protein Bpfe_017905 [Biomphalaria pfeifferi]|uniref:Uncharacterized protein n=1 Tax=Biomphalaria pfeifferi TaxID=112525 RepID=A0AAD8F7E0_BIOPF|nr:hypothetical protein Bpfe_017905 [Biomphalaria pfeifferi]
MAVSRFSSKRKVHVSLDMSEKNKETCGFYRSVMWTGPPNYLPVYPDWQQYRHVAFFRDNGCGWMKSEDVWADYVRPKHQVQSFIGHAVGTQPSGKPVLMRQGHQRNIEEDPPMSMYLHPYNAPWPKKDANMPPARFPRGQYYTYYHDAFECKRKLNQRLQPIHHRILPLEVPNS